MFTKNTLQSIELSSLDCKVTSAFPFSFFQRFLAKKKKNPTYSFCSWEQKRILSKKIKATLAYSSAEAETVLPVTSPPPHLTRSLWA